MKLIRCILILTLVVSSLLLQSCGGGGGSDTAGALVVETKTQDNKDGSFNVAFTTTYSPPADKTAQGVVVSYKWYEDGVLIPANSGSWTYTSLSNKVTIFDNVVQTSGSSRHVSFVANIGSMISSNGVVVPALAPVTGPAIGFTTADVGGAQKTSLLTGGVAPYTVLANPVPTDLIAVVTAGSTLTVTLINTPAGGATLKQVPIGIIDSVGNIGSVTVSYF